MGGDSSDTAPRGVRPSDLLALPEAERRLLQWLMRQGRADRLRGGGAVRAGARGGGGLA